MAVYLEDLDGRKIKCTLFGDPMISQFNHFIARGNGDPVVMVAQLFKPNFYLNETSIQSTFHSSRIFFNPQYPEVMQFRERHRLLALGDVATQGIAEVPTQSQNSVVSELAGGSMNVESIDSVMNMQQHAIAGCWPKLSQLILLERDGIMHRARTVTRRLRTRRMFTDVGIVVGSDQSLP